jgi:hypothetical protein
MKKASEVLRSVRTRLEPVDKDGEPIALSRHYAAMNKERKPEIPLSPKAIAWNLTGAIYATGMTREWDLTGALEYLIRAVGSNITIFVQDAKHEIILERIDDAIAMAERDDR